ncbi:MAG: hypothetical protein WBM69_14975 [Desulfobacterales bacterium]
MNFANLLTERILLLERTSKCSCCSSKNVENKRFGRTQSAGLQQSGGRSENRFKMGGGAGRKFIGKIIGADIAIDEITTHARAAVEIDPLLNELHWHYAAKILEAAEVVAKLPATSSCIPIISNIF